MDEPLVFRLSRQDTSRGPSNSVDACCIICKTSIELGVSDAEESSYLEVDGIFYCAEHKHLRSRDCGGCGFDVNGDAVRAMDKLWHLECFCCFVCDTPLNDQVDTTSPLRVTTFLMWRVLLPKQFYVQGGNLYCSAHADPELYTQFVVRASRSLQRSAAEIALDPFDHDDLEHVRP